MPLTVAQTTADRAGGDTDPRLVKHLDRYEAQENGCWRFSGYLYPNGYGRAGGTTYAHRLFYEAHNGPIPDGLTIDHLCRFTSCVNPAHLEAVSMRENVLRSDNPAALNARKTHCKRGHEFTDANTTRVARGRACKTCRVATNKRHWDKRRGAPFYPIEHYLKEMTA